ncbi:phosphotransferase [Microbacterium jiangjiandongii]|uniref:phosphotransferase n=1 Tax=Microbacterium jiangjiandongii TaxID=3049071 RepID=UPI00214B600E|nr:phosphotransferase [Microbacterium sp. zg.Y843]MCR2815302.1 phosphotransferase [Microbacterium sp. zg.Y843]
MPGLPDPTPGRRASEATNDPDSPIADVAEVADHLLRVDDLRVLWTRFRQLPPAAPEVMTHGDLTPGNLLVAGDRLVGVRDGGGFAPADRALDLSTLDRLLTGR